MNLRSYIKTILTGLAISVMSACADSSDDISMPGQSAPQSETVRMRLNVSIPESSLSRATGENNYQDAVTDNEKISTLRIIILSEDGKVEVNHFIRLSSPTESSGYNEFEVKAKERKTVILIANEPQTDELPFSFYYDMAPLKGQFNNQLYNAVVKYDARELGESPIPMSAVYTVPLLREMATGEDKKTITLPDLRVLRTATKFTFELTHVADQNSSEGNRLAIRVGNIKVNTVADRTFLFPHVDKAFHRDNIHFLEYVYVGGSLSLIEPTITSSEAPVFSGGDGVSDFSYTNFYRDNYQIPQDANHGSWSSAEVESDRYLINPGQTFNVPSFYGHESGIDRVQQYTVTLDLFDKDNNKINTLEAKAPLDNLKRLPRNTHVVVKAKIHPVDYNLEVEVFPYTSVLLRPVFGVDYNAAAHQQDLEQLLLVRNLFQDKLNNIQNVEFPKSKYSYIYVDSEWTATIKTLTNTIDAFDTAVTQSWNDYSTGQVKEYLPILTMDKYLTVATDIQSLSSLAAYIVNKHDTAQ